MKNAKPGESEKISSFTENFALFKVLFAPLFVFVYICLYIYIYIYMCVCVCVCARVPSSVVFWPCCVSSPRRRICVGVIGQVKDKW